MILTTPWYRHFKSLVTLSPEMLWPVGFEHMRSMMMIAFILWNGLKSLGTFSMQTWWWAQSVMQHFFEGTSKCAWSCPTAVASKQSSLRSRSHYKRNMLLIIFDLCWRDGEQTRWGWGGWWWQWWWGYGRECPSHQILVHAPWHKPTHSFQFSTLTKHTPAQSSLSWYKSNQSCHI